MALGKFDPKAVNFVLRDVDTGEVREEFRTRNAALSYWTGMNFGLRNFFEVYDCNEKIVISKEREEINKGGYNYTVKKEGRRRRK